MRFRRGRRSSFRRGRSSFRRRGSVGVRRRRYGIGKPGRIGWRL